MTDTSGFCKVLLCIPGWSRIYCVDLTASGCGVILLPLVSAGITGMSCHIRVTDGGNTNACCVLEMKASYSRALAAGVS